MCVCVFVFVSMCVNCHLVTAEVLSVADASTVVLLSSAGHGKYSAEVPQQKQVEFPEMEI